MYLEAPIALSEEERYGIGRTTKGKAVGAGTDVGGGVEDCETVQPARLATPVLRFTDVPSGSSKIAAVVVRATAHEPITLEVLTPPLAPFSVIERRSQDALEGQVADAVPGTTGLRLHHVWIRYDATSPMASDSGRIVVWSPKTGDQWTVQLEGSGRLTGSAGS